MVLLFLIVSMRSLVRPLLVFVPTVLGLLWSLPLGGALLGPLSPIAISAAAMLIGMGVDFAIHYLAPLPGPAALAGARAGGGTLSPPAQPAPHGRDDDDGGRVRGVLVSHFEGLRRLRGLLVLGLCGAFAATLVALPMLLLLLPAGRRRERSPVVAACERITGLARRLAGCRGDPGHGARAACWCCWCAGCRSSPIRRNCARPRSTRSCWRSKTRSASRPPPW
jgi:hypothetical protein